MGGLEIRRTGKSRTLAMKRIGLQVVGNLAKQKKNC